MDSFDEEVLLRLTADLQAMVKEHVRFVRIADQNTTDFEKCLHALISFPHFVQSICEIPSSFTTIAAPTVAVFGALGGRMDHTLHALRVVSRAACGDYCDPGSKRQFLQIALVDRQNVITGLRPYQPYRLVRNMKYEGKICGVVPFGNSCSFEQPSDLKNLPPILQRLQSVSVPSPFISAVSKGLRWELDGLCLGLSSPGIISSSNESVDAEFHCVDIVGNGPMLWISNLT